MQSTVSLKRDDVRVEVGRVFMSVGLKIDGNAVGVLLERKSKSSIGFGNLYDGFEEEPKDMAWVSLYSNANMVKTDFFEARSTAYAKSTALVDDL